VSESLTDALLRLERLAAGIGRPYAVIGGLAVILRVAVRPTDDLDVLVAAAGTEAERLLEVARQHGYRFDEDEARDLLEVGLIRLRSPAEGGYDLDIILADAPFLEQVVARSTSVAVEGLSLQVATPEDLLLLKLEANRPDDIEDVLSIKDALEERLDRAYLEAEADRLGIRDRLHLYLEAPDRPGAGSP